jgi:hypothetical protein
MFVHLHIPKTGGTSVHQYFNKHAFPAVHPCFPRVSYVCCGSISNLNRTAIAMQKSVCNLASDEWTYASILQKLPEAKVITLIRNPMQEIHSQLEHDIRSPRNRDPKVDRDEIYRYAVREKLTNLSRPGYNVSNVQSSRLGVTGLSFEKLTAFVDYKLFFVGFTDYMWHTLCLLSHAFGKFDRDCDCKSKPAEHVVLHRRLREVRANINTDSDVQYTTSDLRMMYKLTKSDQMLWAAAMPRFVRDLRVAEKAHKVSLVSCMD